ncbi:MAG: type II secretion system F family protein, partial [Alphaproteobacteria bacterium]
MDNLVHTLTDPKFLTALFAAIAAAAVVFTIGVSFLSSGSNIKQRIRRVALEREKMRAEEMARLRGTTVADGPTRTSRRAEGRSYMKNIVERFSLEKAFADENTVDALARAGYRGPAAMTTFLFARFVTPFVLFVVAFAYLALTVMKDNPIYMSALYALFLGLVGVYLPTLFLRNQTSKRQLSIKRAWPDALDLMLLCVESGMSIEHAFKRVSKEIGLASVPLAEELTLTTAELSFLEDRTRAYDNLGRRTG